MGKENIKKYDEFDAISSYLKKEISLDSRKDRYIIKMLAENSKTFIHEMLTLDTKYVDCKYFKQILMRMVYEYPDKLDDIPILHKSAVILCDISVKSFLFSFFAGHYINDENDYIKFLSLLVDNTHTYYVKKLKELEHSWDIINLNNDEQITLVKDLKIMISPINGTIYENIIKITDELSKNHIKPFFNIGTIKIYEYNLYRMLHLNKNVKYSKDGISNIIKEMLNNNFDINESLENIDMYYIDDNYKIDQNISVRKLIEQNIVPRIKQKTI